MTKTSEASRMCSPAEVELSPKQQSEVFDDKLTHLRSTLECALSSFRKTKAELLDGVIDWKKLLAKAKDKLRPH